MKSNAHTLLLSVALPVPLDRTFTYICPPQDADSAGIGALVRVPFGRRKMIGMVSAVERREGRIQEIDGHALKAILEVLPEAYGVDAQRRRLMDWMAGYYALPLGELVPLMYPPAPGTRARGSRRVDREFPRLDESDIKLTADQATALAFAESKLEDRSFDTMLLHGITGSGKTEVYLQAISSALDRGRSAILLLPEIALTPQTEARVRDRLGPRVATLHSGLSAGERSRVHEAAAAGEIRVIVGPRSVVFAPLPDLGLIVVDEEHESSYKQDERPRYHARHVALIRARISNALIILGSATPDLESWRNAAVERYRLFSLSDRPVGVLPVVEIVDMRGQFTEDGFSPVLLQRMEESLNRDRQVILYYNRRGFARILQCASCGEAMTCPHCDIGLTVHLRPRRLLCHYCGFSRQTPAACPACGGESFLSSGSGTEKIELGLSAHFPDARILRMDQDTTRRRGSHLEILGAFAAGEAQILVGTQMIAKGHHFPRVDLVGVLAADDGLHLPDFRAQERAFQLLAQVAGRTGRVEPGAVVFQTWQPEHPLIQAAAAHDYLSFATMELEQRETLGYPPHRRLLRIGLSGRRLNDVSDAADTLAALLRSGLDPEAIEILGPAPAVFARLGNRYRYQLLIKGSLGVDQKRWLADCLRRLAHMKRGVDSTLDFDPVGLY